MYPGIGERDVSTRLTLTADSGLDRRFGLPFGVESDMKWA